MARLSVWMGAGAVAAGVSAAMIAGADVASADTGSGSEGSKSDTSASSSDKGDRPGPRRHSGRTRDSSTANDTNDKAGKVTKVDKADKADKLTNARKRVRDARAAQRRETTADDASQEEPSTPPAAGVDDSQGSDAVAPQGPDDASVQPESDPAEAPLETAASDPEPVTAESDERQSKSPLQRRVFGRAAASGEAPASQLISAIQTSSPLATAPKLPSLPELVQSVVFDFIGVAVTAISGPPVVPAGSNVTVRSSDLEITEGRTVPADWYYPEGDEPPERMILLQHGFLGVSSMYSYTAANLAEQTNSIVVVPTYSSNRFVRDGFWLGDDQVYRATAELFLGDRDALTASALAAGYAQQYGAGVALPDTFVLVGHSLGAGVVAGAAGYYADAVISSGEENHLAGVVLLDGAPPANTLPDALDKLDGLGTYVPVLELGAPKESRRVDAALTEHRPGMFNGVVLTEGKHLDAMQGGSPLIQLMSYLYQGFPTPQNKSASQTLITGWVNDMFADRIDPSTGMCEGVDCAGIYGEPGETIVLPTPAGSTSAVVIGGAGPALITTEFQPMLANALVASRPSAGLLRLV
ncbi:alpha/beta fold hydrolase [Mycolicibacterium sp. XJ870]